MLVKKMNFKTYLHIKPFDIIITAFCVYKQVNYFPIKFTFFLLYWVQKANLETGVNGCWGCPPTLDPDHHLQSLGLALEEGVVLVVHCPVHCSRLGQECCLDYQFLHGFSACNSCSVYLEAIFSHSCCHK